MKLYNRGEKLPFLPTQLMYVNGLELIRVVADITIISFLIYTIFLSIRKFYLSYHIMGLLVLLIIYACANVFNLPMTKTVFKYVLDISLLIWVIVFQREIKKYLEMLPTYIIKLLVPIHNADAVDEILEAVKYMSAHNIGALLIFTGQESIYRYCLRKVRLNGLISKPLLISLFEKKSPTHDGGVIINGNIIESFGAVFSLVERVTNNKKGTRHHAAIEMSQKTDALIVVVSEESGKVSFARRGVVQRASQEELRKQIEQFAYSNMHHKKYIVQQLRSEFVYFGLFWIMTLLFWLYSHGVKF